MKIVSVPLTRSHNPVTQAMHVAIDNLYKNSPASDCRLCGGAAFARFAAPVLERYEVSYWRCTDCGSLQTDPPYWLEEAYARVELAADLGMAARTLQMAQFMSLVLRIADLGSSASCLDYGGGNGLFCRMMRDQGFDFWNHDKYVTPFYCSGFVVERPTAPFAVVTSFEVFEHLAAPAHEIDSIFALKPELWIFSTQLYRDHGADWDYLARANGRHVFFYSARALESLAGRRGYVFVPGRQIHAFIKKDADGGLRRPTARAAIRRVLEGGRLVTLAAAANFTWRQRDAFRHWQSDRDRLRLGPAAPLPPPSAD